MVISYETQNTLVIETHPHILYKIKYVNEICALHLFSIMECLLENIVQEHQS